MFYYCNLIRSILTSHLGATYYFHGHYGQSSGPLLVSNVQCTGFESSLLKCIHDREIHSGCNLFEDVGVRCSGMSVKLETVLVCCI